MIYAETVADIPLPNSEELNIYGHYDAKGLFAVWSRHERRLPDGELDERFRDNTIPVLLWEREEEASDEHQDGQ